MPQKFKDQNAKQDCGADDIFSVGISPIILIMCSRIIGLEFRYAHWMYRFISIKSYGTIGSSIYLCLR